MTRCLLLAIAVAVLMSAPDDLKPRQLQISSTKTFNVPAFSAWGLPLNDQGEDFFFHLGGGEYMGAATIMKLSHSSLDPTFFKLTSESNDSPPAFYEFTVSPSGQVWMLVNSGPAVSAVHFASDGEISGRADLEISLEKVTITDFAALDSGVLFVAGSGTNKSAKPTGQEFAALFSGDSGKQIRILRGLPNPGEDVPSGHPSKQNAPIHAGEAIAGEDGRLYFLINHEIIAISPTGDVTGHTKFDLPRHDLVPIHFRVSGGEAAVWLRTPRRQDGHFETTYLVIDIANKSPVGWYSAPPELKLPAMGFTRDSGLEFLQHDKSGYHLHTAELK